MYTTSGGWRPTTTYPPSTLNWTANGDPRMDEFQKGDLFTCVRPLEMWYTFSTAVGDVVEYDRPYNTGHTWVRLTNSPVGTTDHYVAIPNEELREHFTPVPAKGKSNG